MTEIDWKITKAIRRMKRKREKNTAVRVAYRLLAVAFLAGAAVTLSGAAPAPEPSGRVTVEHTVKRGETLWGIAERHCGDVYILKYMDTLKENNPALIESKGQVYPGQIIRLTYGGE